MSVNTYNLDRKTASRMLSCSLRTVDRYVSSGKIGFVKNSGRTWLSAEDVRALMSGSPSQEETFNEYVSWRETPKTNRRSNTDYMSQDSSFSAAQEYIQPETGHSRSSLSYKDLYHESKQELDQKDKAIEELKIQLAKIETTLKQMVPLFELLDAHPWKGRDQGEQGRPRQVEVSHQHVGEAKLEERLPPFRGRGWG